MPRPASDPDARDYADESVTRDDVEEDERSVGPRGWPDGALRGLRVKPRKDG